MANNNEAHGIYEFYIKSTLINVPNLPNSMIWTEMITMRIGCGFHVQNTNYPPFIEDLTELTDPNFDQTVWSYLDYSILKPYTVASPLPTTDLSTYHEGNHLIESMISCG